MSTYTQNWDGVTPPAIPSGWTVDSGITTAAPTFGVLPTSNPNLLQYNPSSSNGIFCASYGTQDGNSGNVQVQANFNADAQGSHCRYGLVARASVYPFTSLSGNYYRASLKIDTMTAVIQYVTAGTFNTLSTLNILGTLNVNTWYTLTFVLQGSSLSLSILRSDGYWMGSNGQWQSPGPVQACVGASDSTILTQGYSGLTFEQNATSGNYMCSDDFSLTTINPPNPIPTPVIGRVPFGHYPGLKDGGAYVSAMS